MAPALKNRESDKRKAFLREKRFNVVRICGIKSDFVTINSSVLYWIMRKISLEFCVSNKEFTGESRETYWKNILDLKRLKTSMRGVSAGIVETDRVSIGVH